MTDPEVIASRLSKIKESLRLLEPLARMSLAEFSKNPDHFLKGERLLEITIQAMIDIGTHIISSRSLRKPQDYHEVFDILVENRLLPKGLLQPLHAMVGLRNVLIHEYLEVDKQVLHKTICQDLRDVKSFLKAIAGLLRKEGS